MEVGKVVGGKKCDVCWVGALPSHLTCAHVRAHCTRTYTARCSPRPGAERPSEDFDGGSVDGLSGSGRGARRACSLSWPHFRFDSIHAQNCFL